MRLDLDTEVRYESGQLAGRLSKVAFDANNQVSQVVLATSDLISRNVIVPVSSLYEGDGGTVYISATPEEVGQMSDYEEETVPAVNTGWEYSNDASAMAEVFPRTAYEPIMPVMEVSNLGDGTITISQGTEIWCMDDRWGVVDEVNLNDDGTVSAFIGVPDSMEDVRRIIPAQLVLETDATRLVLNCSLADLSTYTQPVPGETSLTTETGEE